MLVKSILRLPPRQDGQIGLEHENAFADRLHEIQWVYVAHGSGCCTPSTAHLLMTGLILDSKNTILLEGLRQPSTSPNYELAEGVLSVMYVTDSVELVSYA